MSRRGALIAAVSAFFAWPRSARAFPPVSIFVGDHKAVTVTFRQMDRKQLISMISDILLTGEHSAALSKVLESGGEITLVMTTSVR